jgi:hypothetical protein
MESTYYCLKKHLLSKDSRTRYSLDAHIGVSIIPGAYAFTVIPYCPNSEASSRGMIRMKKILRGIRLAHPPLVSIPLPQILWNYKC